MISSKSHHGPPPSLGSTGWTGLIPHVVALSKSAMYHLETAFLFTKSDMKTTLIPITVFALGTTSTCASESHPITSPIAAVAWLWIVLLHFNLINQTDFLEEDIQNKPWRPIPANRISLRNANTARWISVPACALISAYLGGGPAFVTCVVFTVLTTLYNCYGGAKNGFLKNIITGVGLCCMAFGTKLVATRQPTAVGSILENLQWEFRSFPELTILFFVISTTTHAQDFEDLEGDRQIGRSTIPMIFPALSRIAMPAILTAWAVVIAAIMNPPTWLAAMYVGLAMLDGFRFVTMRRVEEDKRSAVLYSVWLGLTIVHLCLYKRQAPCGAIPTMQFPNVLLNNVLNSSGILGF